MVAASSLELPRLPATATAVEYLRLKRAAGRAPDAVARDQQLRLESNLAHARRHVPLYRELYRELPDEGPLELARLPVIDKQTIQTCSEEDRRSGPAPPRTRHLRTSGTTGEPTSSDWPPRARWFQGMLTLRMASLQGLPPLHRRAIVDWHPEQRSGGSAIFNRLRRRHIHISALDGPATLAQALEKTRPDAVWSQSHLLIELGEWLNPSFRPSVINTAGQEVTSEDRATLKSIYGSEPLDVYSSSEQGLMAWQCAARDLYHINHEAVIVEVLDGDGHPVPPGAAGELVITGLCNALMPYLRYRTGDAGVIATRPCRCGSTLPALERIEGRLSDWFIDERGRRVPPHRLWLSAHLKEGLDLVRRYQVQQFPSRQVRIQLLPRVELKEDVLQSLTRSYQRLLGATIPVETTVVDRLEEERSHKFRTIMAVR